MIEKTKMPLAKRIIRETLLQFLKEKNFDRISVSDICQSAEIARATFYNHYIDKYQLLEEIEQECISGILLIAEKIRNMGQIAFYESINQNSVNPLFAEYFIYIKKNRNAFEALFAENNGTGFRHKLELALSRQRRTTRQIWGLRDDKLTVDSNYRDMLLSSTYASLFVFWVKHGMNLDEKELGRIIAMLWKAL